MILAIETSSSLCSVAFWENGKIIAEYESDAPMQHASLIGQFVENGLKKTESIPKLVSVAIGPGSFTGLRIGLSFAQGFCFGRKIPIIGVSNHQVLAFQNKTKVNQLYTIIDARRNEVYLAKHKMNALFEIESHQIVNKENLYKEVLADSEIICQDDINIADDQIDQLKEKNIEINHHGKYSAALIAQIGQQMVLESGADDIEKLEPMYLRPFAGVQ